MFRNHSRQFGKTSRRAQVLLLCSAVFFVVPAHAQPLDTETCLSCHSDPGLTAPDSLGRQISFYVDSTAFQESVHGIFQCTDCHADIASIPHREKLKEVNCASCHDDAGKAFEAGIHGKELAAHDPDAPTCSRCHGTHHILPVSDTASTVSPVNQPATCGQCHGNESFTQRHHLPGGLPSKQYENSVHAIAVRRGVPNAPTCSNCHHAHDILPPSDPLSPINRRNVQSTCGKCHVDIAHVYEGSIHGTALHEGFLSAPTCNTCHGEHNIQSPTIAEAATNPTKVSQQVCTPCHSSIVLNQKFGLPTTQVSSYFSSYHGLAINRGSKVAANCTSCHGIHNIYATYDPRSSVNPANLEKTCGKCHPGAQESFARIPVHAQVTEEGADIVAFIRDAYILLIIVVIGGMLLHNLVIYGSAVAEKYKAYRRERTVRRFNINMIVQHSVLLVSFGVLVITGFALKFPEVFQVLGKLGIEEHARSIIHRVAATVLVASSLYHLYWILFRRRGAIEIRAMMPTREDITDLYVTIRYYLGISGTKPRFGRYSYIEKAEYWALIWGTVVMSLTGFVLWFPVAATNFFGAWITPVATVVHFYEAILATLAIVVWHFFFTIFHPAEYPMSLVWINGKVSEEEVKEHRPAWFEEIERRRKAEEKADESPDQERTK